MKTKERKKTHKRHPSANHSSFLFASTDNKIGDTGATSLSKSLKSNTTLTNLYLNGEDKRTKTHKRRLSTIHFFSFLIVSTDNNIGERGASSLSESLKSNATLTQIDLSREDKSTQKAYINNLLLSFSFFHQQ